MSEPIKELIAELREKVEPCPFCGGEARLACIDTGIVIAPDPHFWCKCDTFMCPGAGDGHRWYVAEEAVAAWNTRSANALSDLQARVAEETAKRESAEADVNAAHAIGRHLLEQTADRAQAAALLKAPTHD